ncbi:MAG: DUF560 domain-containing protein [Candidatus Omnitrophica bacterium]|nr:DUF560 domain-containing protein [Candidatus Omnitrophota bacterium]
MSARSLNLQMMRMKIKVIFLTRVKRCLRMPLWAFILLAILPKEGFSVVGKAERYDEFEQEKLNQFHHQLILEEASSQEKKNRDKQMEKILSEQQKLKNDSKDQEAARAITEGLEQMKIELLSLPQRDRFQFEAKGSYKYNSNTSRKQLNREKDDSLFDTRSGMNIDLSGKKTDLRFSLDGGKQWHATNPKTDMHEVHESLNYRRKYFKKIAHSLQTKMGRVDQKTPEVNKDKLRWDFGANSAYHFPISSKLSTNTSFGFDKRLFPQEAFDQDSSWQATSSPSLFWNFTPKSRVSLGYQAGTNVIRSKAGNTNDHSVHLGYFGQVTKKSSTSLDLSAGKQVPKSLEAGTTKTFNAGLGYIWQWTGKTQLTFQLIRSLQNTTVELVSGGVSKGENETSKQDIYFTNDSFSVSLNSRLSRKLTARSTASITHFKNKTHQSGSLANDNDLKDNETMQVTVPFQADLTYEITRHATINLGYTFGYRMADEKPDAYRVHELDTSLRLTI